MKISFYNFYLNDALMTSLGLTLTNFLSFLPFFPFPPHFLWRTPLEAQFNISKAYQKSKLTLISKIRVWWKRRTERVAARPWSGPVREKDGARVRENDGARVRENDGARESNNFRGNRTANPKTKPAKSVLSWESESCA
jgi:hypothetical protein